jgi:hypothetical protein
MQLGLGNADFEFQFQIIFENPYLLLGKSKKWIMWTFGNLEKISMQ